MNFYPEYTGTGLHVLLDADESTVDSLGNSSLAVYEYVKQETQQRFEISWLQPFGFENTYALMMRSEHAKRLGIETISDLTEFLDEEQR
ncbi:MAG: glycine betaine ABC transporter substrate-binding protein [Balneolaceae bacterium]|nr:glycine betaine ABC transporter substrate-binding protein [Balneolaceae bacterium]